MAMNPHDAMKEVDTVHDRNTVADGEPYRLTVNRVRSERLAETYRELEDCLVGLDVARKTVKKAMNLIGRISAEMYEGELVECRDRRNRMSMCY